jgi:hypothetical protein
MKKFFKIRTTIGKIDSNVIVEEKEINSMFRLFCKQNIIESYPGVKRVCLSNEPGFLPVQISLEHADSIIYIVHAETPKSAESLLTDFWKTKL